MQVILDSSFARPGWAPIWGGKKGEFRGWTRSHQKGKDIPLLLLWLFAVVLFSETRTPPLVLHYTWHLPLSWELQWLTLLLSYRNLVFSSSPTKQTHGQRKFSTRSLIISSFCPKSVQQEQKNTRVFQLSALSGQAQHFIAKESTDRPIQVHNRSVSPTFVD